MLITFFRVCYILSYVPLGTPRQMISQANNPVQAEDSFKGNFELVNSELTQAIQQSIQPIMVQGYRRGQTFLAVGAQHGERLMLQINVHATEIPTLLRSRSVAEDSNDPSSGKNRPVNDKHVEAIKDYIVERADSNNKWILGSITANVAPNRIQYQRIWGDLYVVFIPNNTSLEITDGQHRKKAITELIESEDDERDLINEATFPVNLVLEGDFEQCQTDFCDMAQTYPIAKSLLVAYAGFGRDAIAKEVTEAVDIFRNKTQKIKSTPGSRTGHIYTINYISKLVSCAFAGNPSNKLSEINTEELVKAKAEVLSDCLNHFFSTYPKTRHLATQEKLKWQEVAEFREGNILGISVGLEILGYLLHYAYNSEENYFVLDKVNQIAKIDWSKPGECWKETVVINNGKGGFKISAGRGSVSVALERCIEQLGWKSNK